MPEEGGRAGAFVLQRLATDIGSINAPRPPLILEGELLTHWLSKQLFIGLTLHYSGRATVHWTRRDLTHGGRDGENEIMYIKK